MTAIKKLAYKTGMWFVTLLISALVTLGAFYVTRKIISWSQRKKAEINVLPAQFDSRDTVSFTPVSGKVYDSVSDMTVNAVLANGFGAAVVMIYADWCVHCKNMMPAFEEAASKASVPFIRIQGNSAPVVSQKYKVLGYPTILGVSDTGQVHRFNEQRTTEKLLEFSNVLVTKRIPEQVIVVPSTKSVPVTQQEALQTENTKTNVVPMTPQSDVLQSEV